MANGRQPRTAQYDNVLVALYDIPRYPSAPPPLEARHYAFTHAYFPRWAFDQVIERDGWIFGRVGEGYVALYSHLPYQWVTTGPDADQEVITLGRKNVWICQLGRQSVDGTFDEFIDRVSSASLIISGLDVTYQAPGVGEIELGWEGPLRVDGEEVALDGYPRWDNPYTQAAFGVPVYRIDYDGLSLDLDFERGTRVVTE
jgi:hypothetical protein